MAAGRSVGPYSIYRCAGSGGKWEKLAAVAARRRERIAGTASPIHPSSPRARLGAQIKRKQYDTTLKYTFARISTCALWVDDSRSSRQLGESGIGSRCLLGLSYYLAPTNFFLFLEHAYYVSHFLMCESYFHPAVDCNERSPCVLERERSPVNNGKFVRRIVSRPAVL